MSYIDEQEDAQRMRRQPMIRVAAHALQDHKTTLMWIGGGVTIAVVLLVILMVLILYAITHLAKMK